MKKLFLAVMVLAASATATKAQFYIGGNLGFWHVNKWGYTSFNIEPNAGYSFNDRWAAGLAVGFAYSGHSDKMEWYPVKPENTSIFYAEPYARFTYFSKEKVKLFLDGVVGVAAEKPWRSHFWGWQVIVRPGIAINLTDHFSLVGTFGALGYKHRYRNSDGFGLDLHNSLGFGFYYSF